MENEIIETTKPNVPVFLDSEAEEDFTEARATYKELIEKGKSALVTATNIIDSSEHPRAVEVFGGLLKAISDINDKLIDLQKSKYEISKGRQVAAGTNLITGNANITNNTITFGSTEDIIKALKTMKEEDVIEAEIVQEDKNA